MNTTNNNKLIAEFMGITPNEAGVYHVSKHKGYDVENLNYHTSWDWLMPVLKKINLKLTPQNYSEWGMINRPTEYHIKDVYNQVVEFIKQYNK